MAKIQDTSQTKPSSFVKGLNKDSDPTYIQEGMWTHARNAVNNTEEGNLGTLANEDANFLCITAGQTMPANAVKKYIIGTIQLFSDKWVVFTAGHNTARIERPPFYRGGSASKKDGLPAPFAPV